MSAAAVIVAIFAIAGIVAVVAAFIVPRRRTQLEPRAPALLDPPSSAWTREAADEFESLGETARCDLVFAMSVLDDERSHNLLRHALGDPSAAVSAAAAHALVRRGERATLDAYLGACAPNRAEDLRATIALLE